MKTKSKRIWTDEQKAAAADRMRALQKRRWANKPDPDNSVGTNEAPFSTKPIPHHQFMNDAIVQEVPTWEKPNPNDPRLSKLRMMQSQVLSTDDGRRALARLVADKAIAIPLINGPTRPPGHPGSMIEPPIDATQLPPYTRPGSREVNLIVRNDGTIVSQHGPCVCGMPKRMWHKLCLKGS